MTQAASTLGQRLSMSSRVYEEANSGVTFPPGWHSSGLNAITTCLAYATEAFARDGLSKPYARSVRMNSSFQSLSDEMNWEPWASTFSLSGER